ncbi:hypothetical protein [Fodinibius salsisoli]|uniref:ArnR1-like winged helix-turn-helix domain-containing protein n=1 Tax=Fodinibius salsisoli TaxID=2820877 RepID=A0ABT3PN49_9BACT|nr:hypothetical protein [Fodinibius salsisoli]MCW9707337.1 hypothetical protein [Fodinibius salsisoli]
MMIGSKFSKKYHQFLQKIGDLSEGNTGQKISVKKVNDHVHLDRTEIKNALEYLQELGFINIETIGGPFLYGHITITAAGLNKYNKLS